MFDFRKRAPLRREVGRSPGTVSLPLVLKHQGPPAVTVINYGKDIFQKTAGDDIEAALAGVREDTNTWINVDGLTAPALLEALGRRFDLHPLALEDVVCHDLPPKCEDYDSSLFVHVRAVTPPPDLESDQIAFFLCRGTLITVRERPTRIFEPVLRRLESRTGRLRTSGPDYLLYALIDVVIDHYFPVLEGYSERMQALEQEIGAAPTREVFNRIFTLRSELLTVRRNIWPHREIISTLIRTENRLIARTTRLFLRDVYDHVAHLIDITETYREMGAGLQETYLTLLNTKLNEVMKTLTMIATIFLPLTFIAGVYGMNFRGMPEIEWRWGYPFSLILMGAVTLALVLWFRRRRWL